MKFFYNVLCFSFVDHTFHTNNSFDIFLFLLTELFRSIRLKSDYPVQFADRINAVNNEGKIILQDSGKHFTADCTEVRIAFPPYRRKSPGLWLPILPRTCPLFFSPFRPPATTSLLPLFSPPSPSPSIWLRVHAARYG